MEDLGDDGEQEPDDNSDLLDGYGFGDDDEESSDEEQGDEEESGGDEEESGGDEEFEAPADDEE